MKLSAKKREKISEQILAFLYSINPRPAFTSRIADEVARDDAFVRQILEDLKNKKLVAKITKNPYGKNYLQRARWALTTQSYQAYSQSQRI
jgi:DNA-binding IscR family transcriptional regulator